MSLSDPRLARIAKGLTLMQVATAAGVHVSTVHRAEKKGEWPAHTRTREALMKALAPEPPTNFVLVKPQAPLQFAAQLNRWMAIQGLDLATLCRCLELEPADVQAWRAGSARPDAGVLNRLADAMETSTIHLARLIAADDAEIARRAMAAV